MNLPGFASAKALWISWSQRWLAYDKVPVTLAKHVAMALNFAAIDDGQLLPRLQTISHAPIETAYRLPPVAVALSLLGLTAFLGGAFLIKDAARV